LVHGRWKICVLVIHHEKENAPARATPEAMKRLPARTHRERRRFLLMKGAERLEIRPRAFQWKVRTDYFDDIVRGGDLLDFSKESFPCAPHYFCLVWFWKRCQTYAVRFNLQTADKQIADLRRSHAPGSKRNSAGREVIHKGDVAVVPLRGEVAPSLLAFLRRRENSGEQ